MELSDLTQLVKLLDKSGLSELRFSDGASSVVLKKEGRSSVTPPPAQIPAAPPVIAAPVAEAASSPEKTAAPKKYREITSPMVGTFYTSPSPGAEAFVKAGSVIKPKQVLCVIEAMKIMNEIESDISGEVMEVCVANETPVEFGTVLFRVSPA